MEINIDKQRTCNHRRLRKTIVGGFTCDLCGVYLFRLPQPDKPELYTISKPGRAAFVATNVTDLEPQASGEIGQVCSGCATVYPLDSERCPHCALPPQ